MHARFAGTVQEGDDCEILEEGRARGVWSLHACTHGGCPMVKTITMQTIKWIEGSFVELLSYLVLNRTSDAIVVLQYKVV